VAVACSHPPSPGAVRGDYSRGLRNVASGTRVKRAWCCKATWRSYGSVPGSSLKRNFYPRFRYRDPSARCLLIRWPHLFEHVRSRLCLLPILIDTMRRPAPAKVLRVGFEYPRRSVMQRGTVSRLTTSSNCPLWPRCVSPPSSAEVLGVPNRACLVPTVIGLRCETKVTELDSR
jgi:hypothetical protein